VALEYHVEHDKHVSKVEQGREFELLNQQELKEDNLHNDLFAIIHIDLEKIRYIFDRVLFKKKGFTSATNNECGIKFKTIRTKVWIFKKFL
jgi:hypothetical protein